MSCVVVILAAGLGTRMKSRRAKVLHEVAGRPLIVWAVENARAAGATRVIAVLGHQLAEVKAVLDARYGEGAVEIAHQTEQKGTGHAVKSALPLLASENENRTVAIISGDAPLLLPQRIAELSRLCVESKAGMAVLATTATPQTPYGRLVRDESGNLSKIVEALDASPSELAITEMNAGFYAISLGNLRNDLADLSSNNAKGEFYLTDLAVKAHARGGAGVALAPFEEVSGINNRVDLSAVERAARLRINAQWMERGVTFVAPDQTHIEADAGPFGQDCLIAAGVTVRGKSSLGAGVRVDQGSVIDNSQIADDVWIKPYCVISQSTVGEKAEIGPFAHLRPETTLETGAKVGNFVETKKAHIMAGAKASHLSYLGDVSIGAKANVGAGTITCNYDGFTKHKTVIEAGAFIGSDSQLVAPVTIGKDAYVGSGTTVTKDVPRGALALSRSKQVNVDGWADRFRDAQGKRKARTGRSDTGSE